MDTPGPPPQNLSSLSLPADRDRRAELRLSAEILGLDVDASLSQGVFVRVLNVSPGGALVELQEWLRPGTKSSLKLARSADETGARDRLVANGHIVRCWVDRLAPLRYRAAIVFNGSPASSTREPIDLTVLLERPA